MGMTKWVAAYAADYTSGRDSFGVKLRKRRIKILKRIIEKAAAESGKAVTILDVGGTRAYWNLLSDEYREQYRVHITIANLPGINRNPTEEPGFFYIDADACNLSSIGDHQFDIAHSNSVVEHVGNWGRMKAFATEVQRTAKYHYVQTPSFWFPIEPHCMTPLFHWLPLPMKQLLVLKFPLGHWPKAKNTDEAMQLIESASLLNKRMLVELFPKSQVITERIFLLEKSLVALSPLEQSRIPSRST